VRRERRKAERQMRRNTITLELRKGLVSHFDTWEVETWERRGERRREVSPDFSVSTPL
jgi:hypothetical protein